MRNQRGQHASGKKVTSIQAVPGQPQQFLITTNDSRLRLIEGYGQVLKYKGHKNSNTQARAALSPDGSQLACGSDDGCLYLWQRTPGSGGASSGGAGAAGDASGGGGGVGGGGAGRNQTRGGGGGGSGGSGGGVGGGAERAARSMAAAAAAQYQQLMSKNAAYQAFQAHEPGLPVTAVAFLPQAAVGLPKFSVMVGQSLSSAAAAGAAAAAAGSGAGGGGGVVGSGGAAAVAGAASSSAVAAVSAAEAAFWDTRKCFVQQLLVSAGFNGSIRVHELLSGPTQRSRSVA